MKILFLRDGTGYYQTVIDKYWNSVLQDSPLAIRGTTISVSYIALLTVLVIALCLLYRRMEQAYSNGTGQSEKCENNKTRIKVVMIAAVIQAVLYIFMMCAVYIYNFSEYDATILASFQRYLNMAMMPLWIMIIYGFLNTGMVVRERTSMLIIASVVFFFTPTKAIYSVVTRASIESGVAFRARYEEMRKKIKATCDGNDNIYFISQGDNGFDYWVNRFNARPNNTPVYDRTGWSWSLGEPFYDGDIWTKDIPSENFQEVLISNCDYLAVFRTNDYFNEHYGSLFAGEIKNQSIYRVNKETGLMEACE